MPSRARLDEFIACVESGDHAGAIERYYTSGPDSNIRFPLQPMLLRMLESKDH